MQYENRSHRSPRPGREVLRHRRRKGKREEVFPSLEDTANVVVTLKAKAEKGNAKTCAKDEEVGLEAWLGPLGEEFEAELT